MQEESLPLASALPQPSLFGKMGVDCNTVLAELPNGKNLFYMKNIRAMRQASAVVIM